MTKTDDDMISGLMSTLKRISQDAVAEYQRERASQPDDAMADVILQLANDPIRFRGYSIRPTGGMWLVASPIHLSYTWEFQSLGEALGYINTTLAEPF